MQHKLDESNLTLVFEEDLISTQVESCLKYAKDVLAEASGVESLVLDLSGVQTVDSQGLNLLVALYQESRSLDWEFSVSGASSNLIQLFKFVKLSERFGLE